MGRVISTTRNHGARASHIVSRIGMDNRALHSFGESEKRVEPCNASRQHGGCDDHAHHDSLNLGSIRPMKLHCIGDRRN